MTTQEAHDRKTKRVALGCAAAAGLFAGIVAANYLTTRFGFVPVGFGLAATAGTFAAGVTLALRDAIQDTLGRKAVLAAIVAGSILSFAVADPAIALASAVAFLLAELLNFAVYTPIRERARFGDKRWAVAVASSNLVGAVVDTAVFIGIAFGASAIVPAMAGQLVGKAWATVLYLLIGGAFVAVLRQPMQWGNDGSHA